MFDDDDDAVNGDGDGDGGCYEDDEGYDNDNNSYYVVIPLIPRSR